MSKKILILSASPRKGGNSDLLCDQFAKGAEEAGPPGGEDPGAGAEDRPLPGLLRLPGHRRLRPEGRHGRTSWRRWWRPTCWCWPPRCTSTPWTASSRPSSTGPCPGTRRSGTRRSTSSPPPPRARGAMERTMDAMRGFTDCLPGAQVKGPYLRLRRLPEGRGAGDPGRSRRPIRQESGPDQKPRKEG